jgi:hypothetical protein
VRQRMRYCPKHRSPAMRSTARRTGCSPCGSSSVSATCVCDDLVFEWRLTSLLQSVVVCGPQLRKASAQLSELPGLCWFEGPLLTRVVRSLCPLQDSGAVLAGELGSTMPNVRPSDLAVRDARLCVVFCSRSSLGPGCSPALYLAQCPRSRTPAPSWRSCRMPHFVWPCLALVGAWQDVCDWPRRCCRPRCSGVPA